MVWLGLMVKVVGPMSVGFDYGLWVVGMGRSGSGAWWVVVQ